MNADQISFTVYGKAEPQGSIRAFVSKAGKPILTSTNPNLKEWREQVGWAAREQMAGRGLVAAAVEVRVSVYLVRPKSVKRANPTVKPDVDKLLRGALDALTGIVYHDDAQVTSVHISKHYVNTEVPHPCMSVWASWIREES